MKDVIKDKMLEDIFHSGCALMRKENGRYQIWTPMDWTDENDRKGIRMIPDCFADLEETYKFWKRCGLKKQNYEQENEND